MSRSLFGQAFFAIGPEEFLREQAIEDWVESAKQERPTAEVRYLEGPQLGVADFSEAIGGSLFSTESIVVLRDLATVDESCRETILATVEKPSLDLCLILAETGGNRARGFITKIRQAKPVIFDASIKKYEVAGFVQAQAKKHGAKIAVKAVQELIDILGTDLRTLVAALNQLKNDYESDQITSEMVATYFSGRADMSGFKVADELLAGRLPDAIAALRWCEDSGVEPVQITAALANGLRSLGKYFGLAHSGLKQSELSQKIGVPPWKLKILAQQAKVFSALAVANAISLVSVADAGIKGGGKQPMFTLEKLLLDIDQARKSSLR